MDSVVQQKCLLIGFNPKDYSKDGQLGIGGFGTVKRYRRLDLSANQEMPTYVACKKVLVASRKFRREYEILEALRHKNILILYQWQIENKPGNSKCLVLYTEMCHQNLRYFMKEFKNLTLIDVKVLSRQLITGCSYLHFNSVIHRDIKPENILVYKRDLPSKVVLKLADFGLARFISQSSEKHTTEMTTCGTKSYSSPEMLQGNKSALSRHPYATDIFSLGVVIFEMITRKIPFELGHLCQQFFDGKSILEQHIKFPSICEALKLMLNWEFEIRPNATDIAKYFSLDTKELFFSCTMGFLEILQAELENTTDVDQTNDEGQSLLYVASKEGHSKIVRLILGFKPDVNKAATSDGSTPLYVACQNGHANVVRLLLEKEADAHKTTTVNETPLYVACKNDRVKVVKLLLHSIANVNQRRCYGRPLRIASQKGCKKIVQLLLEHVPFFEDLLVFEALINGHLEVVKLLLERKRDVTCPPSDGIVPLFPKKVEEVNHPLPKESNVNRIITTDGSFSLYVASRNGDVEMVRNLLQHGAAIDTGRIVDSSTPLWTASQNGRYEIVQLLLENQADVNKTRFDGSSPLYVAVQNGHVKVAKILLENKADVNLGITENGNTPLHVAVHNGDVDLVRLLLEHGAKMDQVRTDDGSTALWMASDSGHLDLIKLLVEKPADVNLARNDNGSTPLHVAAKNGDLEAARILVEGGADVSAVNKYGVAGLTIAKRMGHDDVVKFFEQYGK